MAMLVGVLEANHYFYEYYKPYINSDWKHEYFAYDHFKHLYKAIKARDSYSHSPQVFHDFQLQCFDEIKRVHKFLASVIRQIDADLSIVNETLGSEGVQCKPSELRVSLAASAFAEILSGEDDHDYDHGNEQGHDRSRESSRKSTASARHVSRSFSRSHNNEDAEHHRSTSVHRAQFATIQKAISVSKPGDAYRDQSIELALRNLYSRIKEIDKFYQLNYFCIRKISKKIDKLLKINKFTSNQDVFALQPFQQKDSSSINDRPTSGTVLNALIGATANEKYLDRLLKDGSPREVVRKSIQNVEGGDSSTNTRASDSSNALSNEGPLLKAWKETTSGTYFFEEYIGCQEVIAEMRNECVAIYTKKFRKTYADLAAFELEYVKERDRVDETTNIYVGLKLGLIVCMTLWVMADSYSTQNDFDFWEQPGLYMYTTIGNLLLFRFCWAFNIFVWSKYDVNFISILHLKNMKPNLLLVIDQTATLMTLYFFNLLVFFRANSSSTLLDESFFSYGCPLILLVVSVLYQIYEYFYLFGGDRVSRGVFSRTVLRNCVMAPFVAVTFRDVYSADVLTSFTRIIADSLYASCWVVSGAFLTPHDTSSNQSVSSNTDFGSSYMHCTGTNMLYVVSIVQMIPLITRTLQCLRSMRDSNFNVYPQGYNACKYLLSVAVVIIGLQDSTDTALYFLFIALSTFYKWWWDVVMDWGLFDVMPSSLCELLDVRSYGKNRMFLRKSLMYPNVPFYYFCIVIDLILRFLWVLSTLPQSSLHGLIGYQLSFFLGSMEILRRCMWGILRVEWEHLKMLKNKTPGFLSNHVLRKHENGEDGNDGYDSDEPGKALKSIKEKKVKKNKKFPKQAALDALDRSVSSDAAKQQQNMNSPLHNVL